MFYSIHLRSLLIYPKIVLDSYLLFVQSDGNVEFGFELEITYSDIIMNYRFSSKLKLLGNDEFIYLTNILTPIKLECLYNGDYRGIEIRCGH
jgi:hypothetical protein